MHGHAAICCGETKIMMYQRQWNQSIANASNTGGHDFLPATILGLFFYTWKSFWTQAATKQILETILLVIQITLLFTLVKKNHINQWGAPPIKWNSEMYWKNLSSSFVQ